MSGRRIQQKLLTVATPAQCGKLDDRVQVQASAAVGDETSCHEAPPPAPPPLDDPAALALRAAFDRHGERLVTTLAGPTLETRAAVQKSTAVGPLAAAGRRGGAHRRPNLWAPCYLR